MAGWLDAPETTVGKWFLSNMAVWGLQPLSFNGVAYGFALCSRDVSPLLPSSSCRKASSAWCASFVSSQEEMFQSKAPQIKEFNGTFVHTTVFEESQSFGMAIAQTKQQQHETNCASSCPYHLDTREPPNKCAPCLCSVASRSKGVARALCGNVG